MTSTRTRNIKTLDIIRENNMIPKSSEYSNLNKKSLFKRWDLIPRYLAIENHYGENDYGWDLFRKLRLHQSSEFGDGTAQTLYDQTTRTNFETLIESIKIGYNRDYPIVVNETGLRINKGWLRFACCLYFQIDEIPCKFDTLNPNPSYSKSWMMTEVGYTNDEMLLIEESYLRIFEKLSGNILYNEG
tara:strand:+ start:17 stop:577 length:561 start_codon:yes stop_codon:yes gene_type:complete